MYSDDTNPTLFCSENNLDWPQLRLYLLAKPEAQEYFPFKPDIPVYQVRGKLFALRFTRNNKPCLNLKCAPKLAAELRAVFPEITPGYHMHKLHWNTLDLSGQLPSAEILRLIDHSYTLVVRALPRQVRQTLRRTYVELDFLDET